MPLPMGNADKKLKEIKKKNGGNFHMNPLVFVGLALLVAALFRYSVSTVAIDPDHDEALAIAYVVAAIGVLISALVLFVAKEKKKAKNLRSCLWIGIILIIWFVIRLNRLTFTGGPEDLGVLIRFIMLGITALAFTFIGIFSHF